MDALGGGSPGGLWWSRPFNNPRRRRRERDTNSSHNASSESSQAANGGAYRFPLKQAMTAASLAFAGDTIAQLSHRRITLNKEENDEHFLAPSDDSNKDIVQTLLLGHDWLRALRMTSYGFFFYGPGSYVWYQTLDHHLPQPTVKNLLVKVLLNQIILGPTVIAVVFAWNNLWQQKLSELPRKYQKDALPTLLFGFRFWIPYSVLNFWYFFCPFLLYITVMALALEDVAKMFNEVDLACLGSWG